MVQKGQIKLPSVGVGAEDSKVEFFRRVRAAGDDATAIIFKDTSPTVVQQAALFITKLSKPGHTTSIPGVIRADHYAMTSYEYIKQGSNWILYLNFEADMKQGIEFTKLNQRIRLAIAKIEGVNYLAYEGSDKVFVISGGFAGSFGAIDLDVLNKFMDSQEDKDPYRLSNISQEAYLADAPEQLFGDDTVFYRDGEQFGFWMSFGTLVKIDSIDFNNINIDGVPVAMIDKSLSVDEQFKRMLNAKAAGYACVLFDQEAMLKYLLEEAKRYVLTNKQQDLNKVCLEDLLRNVSEKGLLGIVYQKVESLKEMYIPAFDYTQAKVKDVVGEAIAFIYDDEYIWMHYDKENKEIDFLTYKGDVLEYKDKNISVTLMPEPTLSKVNKVNDENFVLFTGFKNLEVNNVLDIYFDGKTTILNSKNKQYAIDITAFDDFYKEKVSNFNANFNEPNEMFKIYGTNKYALITGLIHYEGEEPPYELKVNTDFNVTSIIDPVEKKAHLNVPTMANFGYRTSVASFRAPSANFENFAKMMDKGEGSKINPMMFYFFNVAVSFKNGYFTFKDGDRFITVKADGDKYLDFIATDMFNEILEKYTKLASSDEVKLEPKQIAAILEQMYKMRVSSMLEAQDISMDVVSAKKIRVVDEKERWVFEKVSDNMYVNNKPTSEICNHAILFEDAFQRAQRDMVKTPVGTNIKSPYILAAKLKEDEEGYIIEVKTDISEKSNVFITPRLGLTFANIPRVPDIKYMKLKPQVLVKYDGVQEIKGSKYNIFLITYGFRTEADMEAMFADAKNMFDGKPQSAELAQTQGRTEYYKAMEEDSIKKSKSPGAKKVKLGQEEAKLKVSIDNSFVPIGLEVMVAYKSGKILVSIGGQEFYEPYESDNGLRLNYNIYLSDVDAFERELRNMMLSDYYSTKYDGYFVNEHIVTPQQVKVNRIMINKDLTLGIAEIEFRDIPGVVNDILYKPNEKILYAFDLDIDVDYIDRDTNKRVVFADIVIEYKTIYPIDTKREISSAEDITMHENCFTVKHHIPITLALDSEGYMYEKKSQAIADGAWMFVNFTRKDEDEQ